jgi:hypothetical protein
MMALLQQQPHPGAVQKAEIAEAEQFRQAKHGLIKLLGAVDIGDAEGNLADMAEIEASRLILRRRRAFHAQAVDNGDKNKIGTFCWLAKATAW